MTALESSVAILLSRVALALGLLAAATAILLRRQIGLFARATWREWREITLRCDRPIALTLLTIAAALVRLPDLWHPMGTDESATFLYYASKPLLIGVSIYGSPNNHLLHTALMHIAFLLFGDAEWALRIPAYLAGVAMVPLTCLAARAITATDGLVAAAIVAGWPVLIDYSTDGRGYTLLCCFVLICAAAMSEIIRSGNRAACTIFIISAALGFFALPVMLYPFAMLIAWGAQRRKETLLCAAATVALTVLLYGPALIVSGIGAIAANAYVRPLPAGDFVRALPSYAAGVHQALWVAVPLLLQLLLAAGFIAALTKRRFAIFWGGFLAVIAILAVQRVLPFPRVWLPFIPLVAITAASMWRIAQRPIAAALFIALGLSAIAVPRVRETGELRAVREIVRELRVHARGNDPVLTLPPSDMPLAFYTRRARVPVEILFPDVRRQRMFVVENRDYGQTLAGILRAFRIDARAYRIRTVRDFGSSVLYELTRR